MDGSRGEEKDLASPIWAEAKPGTLLTATTG